MGNVFLIRVKIMIDVRIVVMVSIQKIQCQFNYINIQLLIMGVINGVIVVISMINDIMCENFFFG